MKKSCTDQTLLKVLVVEDSIDLQLLLRAMLSEISGVEVIASVESEEEALEAIRSSCTDLAIVDLELDSGTGLGVLKNLFESPELNKHPVSVVVFSNYSNLVIRHRCLSLGAKAFFDKSFQVEELLEFVQVQASCKAKDLSA
ncbi:response regulator [Limnobacter sp. P1]|uniref:response regulator n=1 Tax=Limnobacter olei TaxID=3031298 RepID=UPI0023AF76F1|nr:response regulator [Limnobacter sp. P1]